MAMNFRRRQRVVSEVNTSSLNDIMFFLLLFFLITSTLVNPNVVPVSLPKANSQGVVQQNVVVSIDKAGIFFVNRQPTTSDKLQTTIERELAILGRSKDPVVLVNADEEVPWRDVVRIMSIGKKINARVFAATKPE